MTGASSPFAAAACGPDDVTVCGVIYRWTGNKGVAQTLDVVLGTPLRIVLIIGLGLLLRRVLHRLINRMATRMTTGRADHEAMPGGSSLLLIGRREARARTLASVLQSVTTVVVGVIVVLMVLQELDFSVAPLLASAGVAGVALGFGAQSLVKDVVSGIFMIFEDQYGVGDIVDVGEASGVVEAVGLRISQLRDVNGTVWYVRNGEILRVGNQSQGWSRAVLDTTIGFSDDVSRLETLLLDVARGLAADPQYAALIIDQPQVWGIEAITADGIVLRLGVKTQSAAQWAVTRELRARIKSRFDAEGIQIRPVPAAVAVNGEDQVPAFRG